MRLFHLYSSTAKNCDNVSKLMSAPIENVLNPPRHSRLGIVSTVIAVAIPVLLVIFIGLVVVLGSRKNTFGNYFAGAGLIFSLIAPVLHLIGAALGVGGLFTKNTKKLFPVFGTVLNIMLGISGVLLWVFVISNLSYGFR